MKTLFKSFVLIAAAAFTLSACSKSESITIDNANEVVTLKFNIRNADGESLTKALLGTENGQSFLNWENGDHIGAYLTGSTNAHNRQGEVEVLGDDYTLNVQAPSTMTVAKIYSYFPYSVGAGTNKEAAVVTIPELQHMSSEGFDADAMPMAGSPVDVSIDITTANTNYDCGKIIDFSNLGSIIKFRVYTSGSTSETLTSVTYKASGIGGSFSIDLTQVDAAVESTLALTSTDAIDEITTSYATKPAIGSGAENAIDVYMVVAPGTYSGSQVVVTTNEHTYTLDASSEKTFTRSHVKPIKIDISKGTPGDLPADETWVRTPLNNLSSEDVFVIVGTNSEGSYAMSNNNGTGSAPAAIAVTIADDKITSEVANTIKWNVSGNATDGYTFYPNGSTTTWLYCTNTNNGVRVGDSANKVFTIDGGYLKNTATSRYVGVYNSQDWRCYTSSSQANIAGQSFAFYVRTTAGPAKVATPTISISGTDVSIACATEGATIYYTVDGSAPSTSSSVYSDAVSILGSQQKTIKAFATKTSYDDSEVASETYYAINVNSTTNGTVTAVPFAAEGEEIIPAITPADGYALDQLSVVDGSDNAVAVSNNKFTMPASPVFVTATFAAGNDGSLEHPYTVAEALAIINGYSDKQKSTSEVYVSGIIANVGNYNSTYHSVTYDISDDGQNANTLNIYSGKFVANTNFSSNDQISVNDQVIVYGYLYLYGSTKEMYQNNYIYSLNGTTKALTAGSLTATPNNANKQITVTWGAATGTESAISYVVNCGTQSYNANAAGSHTFTMADYGTYDVSVVASASDALSATAAISATLTDPNASTPTLQYTLDGTDTTQGSNGYATNSEITQSSIDWIAVANTTINPWRFGGKNLSGVDRAVYSTTAIDSNISSIEVESGTATATVNSLTITVHNSAADAASGSNAIATKSVTSGITSSTVTLTKTDATSWAGKYYRIVYNVTCGGSNQYVQFKSAKFYGTN